MAGRTRVLHVNGKSGDSPGLAAAFGRAETLDVTTTTSVGEAVAAVESAPVDCVVSVHSPGEVDGLACLDAVRDAGHDGPFFLVADADRSMAREALDAGVTDCLSADVVPEIALNLVTSAVDAARNRRRVEEYEARVTTTERRLTELIEQANDVLWMFTADWEELLFVNGAYEEVWGRSRAALDDDPLDFVRGVHPDDRETVRSGMRELSAGESVDVEYRVNAGEDYGRWVWVQAEPIVEAGEVVRVVGFARDVTDHHRRERELQQQNDQLENIARVLSHDLRNPLNVALVRLGLAREECDSDHLDHAEAAIERIDRMIDTVLTLTWTGRTVDRTAGVDVTALARDSWETVSTGGAELRVDEGLVFDVDPDTLRHAFENLFRNSVEHGSTSNRTQSGDSVEHGSTSNRTQSGDSVEHGSTSSRPAADDVVERGSTSRRRAGDDITVRVGALDDGSGVYVADDGSGIPPGERGAVTEAGYTTSDEGTGFGLNIVRQVVEAHGGSLTVTGGDGGGARFEMTFGTGVATVDEN